MTFKNTIRIILTILTLVAMPASFADTDTKRGITIDDLSAIRDIQTTALSPDGKYIAFQVIQAHKDTNDFTTDWYIAATKPGAKPIRIAKDAEAIVGIIGGMVGGKIIWSPDSEWVYFTKKHQGAIQVWRSSRSKPEQQQVTHNAGDIKTLTMSPDGSKVFFTIGRTRAGLKALKRKASEQGFLQQEPKLYSVRYGIQIPACTDGQERLPRQGKNKYSCRLTHWTYDIQSGVERKATEVEIKTIASQEDFLNTIGRQSGNRLNTRQMKKLSPDGRQLAWIENTDPEIYKGVYPPMILSLFMKGKILRCPAKECISLKTFFKGLWWHPNGKEIIFHVVDGPYDSLTSYYSWTPGEDTVRTILRTDDYVYNGQPCDLTGKRLICTRSTWTSPKEIVSIDIDNGKISTIVNVNPEFRGFSFTKIEKIFGKDDYGHKVYGHLVYPKGYKKGQRYPLVITQYTSKGFLRGAAGDGQPIHAYAQNGIAVLSIDHRFGYKEWAARLDPDKTGAAFQRSLYIKQGPATAIENMVESLVDRGIIDQTRVGITGFSGGSYVLTTALFRKNYAAASTTDLFSVTTYAKYSPSSFERKLFNETFGKASSAQGQEMRRKYSVSANAPKIDTPYLIQTADNEFNRAEVPYNSLQDAGKPVEMYVYPDELHVKWQPAHKYMVYSRNIDWFNFWLQGIEDPDPAKAEQYVRWRELREMHEANLEKLEEKTEKNK